MFKGFHNSFILYIFGVSKIIFLFSVIIFSFFILHRLGLISNRQANRTVSTFLKPNPPKSEDGSLNGDTVTSGPSENDILKLILRFSDEISSSQAKKLAKLIIEECDNYEIDPSLVLAIIQVESNFSPTAVSDKGAIGLMQVMPSTADYLAEKLGISISGKKELHDPFLNVRLGIYYISLLEGRFDNVEDALFAYYYGPSRFESYRYVGRKLPKYVRKVLSFKSFLDDEINVLSQS
jgi:soluble lytic murein transglycosylase